MFIDTASIVAVGIELDAVPDWRLAMHATRDTPVYVLSDLHAAMLPYPFTVVIHPFLTPLPDRAFHFLHLWLIGRFIFSRAFY